MREVQDHGQAVTPRFVELIDTCVQCRGCETACPSGVPYGSLVDQTLRSLAEQGNPTTSKWLRLALIPLQYPRLLALGSAAIAVAQRAGLPTKRFGLPPIPIRKDKLAATGQDVWLHTGCVMDAWYRPVHQASLDVLEHMGLGAALPNNDAACCGALQHHAGDHERAETLAANTIRAMPGDRPILVDSAGCGAALKDYGALLGTPEAESFSKRVYDIHEFLEANIASLPEPNDIAPWSGKVAIQDPCHLRHVQRSHDSVRVLLSRYGRVALLDDEGLCCGAGGSYSLQHPELANGIRDRKHASISRSGATIIASANPGCAGFLDSPGARTEHPVVLLAAALSALNSDDS